MTHLSSPGRSISNAQIFLALTTITVLLSFSNYSQSNFTKDPFEVSDFDCAQMSELGIEKQTSFRASAILRYCATGRTDYEQASRSLIDLAYRMSAISNFGGSDINLITGPEADPHIVQAESAAWAHGNTVVVAMDDSRGAELVPLSFCSVSVSTNGGATFARLAYGFNQTGACYGDPSVFYSVRAGKWFVGFLAERCPGIGFGQWESADGISWSESGCVTGATVSADWLSSWVDNNPGSPYYGRQYALYNNFNQGSDRIEVVHSTDDGVNWSTQTAVTSTFERAIKIFGTLGPDGIIYVQALDEGGGGLAARINRFYLSQTGGATWTAAISQGPAFAAPGRSVSGYFAGMYTSPVAGYWRYMGSGQPATGANGVVHYVYTTDGAGMDPGDIYYVRSIDGGLTWLPPLRLNSDATSRAQFQPSLTANAHGKVVASWYDERNTSTDALQRFTRVSHNSGATWGPEMPTGDVVFPKPLQQDPSVNPAYVGDRHDAAFSNDGQGNVALDTWTDGRVPAASNGQPQQDVFLDKINFASSLWDFDGDGRTDIGIFRPSVSPAEWWINRSTDGQTFALQFGVATDKIVPADFTGDGKADIAFWRHASGEWFILRSEDFSFFAFPFGANNDIPAPADYDADGKADPAVFRPSSATWFISHSNGSPTEVFQFGINGDQPVVADYDSDGKADIGIFRNAGGAAQWWIQRSTAGLLAMQFGAATDKAVQGDYTGDGRADVAVWKPTTGQWLIVRSEDFSFFGFPFGGNGDIVAPGDYDGDGKFDAAVFRPASATWFIARSTAGTQIVQFGATGDRPIANAFVP